MLQTFQSIDAICIDGDGLKWFNWLYLQVTQAVETRVAAGGFSDPASLVELDVQFARLYLGAVEAFLTVMANSWVGSLRWGKKPARGTASFAAVPNLRSDLNLHRKQTARSVGPKQRQKRCGWPKYVHL